MFETGFTGLLLFKGFETDYVRSKSSKSSWGVPTR